MSSVTLRRTLRPLARRVSALGGRVVEAFPFTGLGLLVVALMYDRLPKSILQWVARGFTLGVVLFSGSLYLLSTRELSGLQGLSGILGPLTPLGGLCFILGWVLLLITALRKPDPR